MLSAATASVLSPPTTQVIVQPSPPAPFPPALPPAVVVIPDAKGTSGGSTGYDFTPSSTPLNQSLRDSGDDVTVTNPAPPVVIVEPPLPSPYQHTPLTPVLPRAGRSNSITNAPPTSAIVLKPTSKASLTANLPATNSSRLSGLGQPTQSQQPQQSFLSSNANVPVVATYSRQSLTGQLLQQQQQQLQNPLPSSTSTPATTNPLRIAHSAVPSTSSNSSSSTGGGYGYKQDETNAIASSASSMNGGNVEVGSPGSSLNVSSSSPSSSKKTMRAVSSTDWNAEFQVINSRKRERKRFFLIKNFAGVIESERHRRETFAPV